jgi:hypothetical protein
MHIEERNHESGSLIVATNTARRLDILGMSLWLAQYDHKPEPLDVETYGDHVRRYGTVHALLNLVEPRLKSPTRFGHLVSRDP